MASPIKFHLDEHIHSAIAVGLELFSEWCSGVGRVGTAHRDFMVGSAHPTSPPQHVKSALAAQGIELRPRRRRDLPARTTPTMLLLPWAKAALSSRMMMIFCGCTPAA